MSAKILIADDEPNILLSLEFLMKREGFEVLTARDGQEAVEAAQAHLPDLILLDVMMPRKNGFDVCQELRARDEFKSTRILMLTAKGRELDVTKGMALGADAYMTKPFGTRELVETVRRLLEARP